MEWFRVASEFGLIIFGSVGGSNIRKKFCFRERFGPNVKILVFGSVCAVNENSSTTYV
jgi:hypothetical protein